MTDFITAYVFDEDLLRAGCKEKDALIEQRTFTSREKAYDWFNWEYDWSGYVLSFNEMG